MSARLHEHQEVLGNRYRIEEYVAEGGMQQVYKATDLLLNRIVALKSPKNLSAEKRFQRSAVVAACVNHYNVAKTLDYFEEGTAAFLIEEFVEGDDLGAVLKAFQVIDPLTVARVFHRLSKGLAASHHVDVVHRDLKPSNVMALGGVVINEVKITDFGIAKMAKEEIAEANRSDASLTASQTAIGAIPYMAPEMIHSIHDAGKSSDVWSIGAMMYELLFKAKPFGAGLGAVPRVIEAKVAPPNIASFFKAQFRPIADELLGLIRVCLVKDPAKRPTADDLVRRCENLCYPLAPLEIGVVSRFDNSKWGFANSNQGDIFFHVDSCPIHCAVRPGDRIAFARHPGGGTDRAFPFVPLVRGE